jgi:hypothetical protein
MKNDRKEGARIVLLLLAASAMALWSPPVSRPNSSILESAGATLLEVGRWLDLNGEAIYRAHSWIKFGEGGRGEPG